MPFGRLTKQAKEAGIVYGESNPELEDNIKVQSQWDYFKDVKIVRRRAVFYKSI